MRILHTSDWHLGRCLGEHRLLTHQAEVVDRLVEMVRTESVEAVVVAGDLFDRSIPPADAWELLWEAFRRITDAGAPVVAITGNHDSAERMGATGALTEAAGVHLHAGHRGAPAIDVLPLRSGPLAVVSVPYLDPLTAPAPDAPAGASDGSRSTRRPTHESLLAAALGRARTSSPAGVPRLAVAHAFVTGAAPSSSERELSVGEAAMVSASVFEGFDYVALGHLHVPQCVAGHAHLRYSGSPLAYSFSETRAKEAVLVDLVPGAAPRATSIPLGVGPGVRIVRGALDELVSGEEVADWVRAELTDEVRPVDAARRLRPRYPRLAEVAWVGARMPAPGAPPEVAPEVPPHRVAATFWEATTGAPPRPEELDLLVEVLGPAAERGAAA